MKYLQKNFLNLYKKYNHVIILSYYIIIYVWFSYLENNINPKYYMQSKIDPYIPFIKVFVVPYLLWFGYIAIPMIYFGLKSKNDFLKLSIFMFSGMSICFTIYMLFPNGQNLRPEIIDNDIFSKIIGMLYLKDTPTNSAPSIHVINSIAVHSALINYKGFKDKLYIKVGSFILMILIILSTVFIKQHSALDVMYGIILAMTLYLLIYKVNFRLILNFNKNLKRTDRKENIKI